MRQSRLFSNISTGEAVYDNVDRASIKGIAGKTFFLLGITILVGVMMAIYLPTILNNNPGGLYVALGISSVVGFISVMVGRMSDRAAKFASFIYAVCEGLFLGTLSRILDEVIPGASFIAVFSTLIVFTVMLTLFSLGVIKMTAGFYKFLMGISFGAIGIVLFMMIFQLIAGPIENLGVLIGIELFLLFYGVITLTFNFHEASMVVKMGCDKRAEWSVALGLMVSLVYIYVEIIRLVALFASNDN